MQAIPDEIFRAYDIRGIVGPALNVDVMTLIGRAIGSEALDHGESSLVLAADARLSSPMFTTAIQTGILSSGCNVIFIGIVPTPLMYFATHVFKTHSGVMITGSHNPKDYNGVKMVLKQKCLAEEHISKLKKRILTNDFHTGNGEFMEVDLRPQYIGKICETINLKRNLKVVIDSGNGVTGNIAPRLFERLGCEVIPLYCQLDGHFPNHHPDPTIAKNLQALIREVKLTDADLGIAFDGDGDRLGLISKTGRIIDADKMMMTFIKDILPENPGATIIADVKSSQHIFDLITAENGNPVMCKSGHSFVKHKMSECNALLGGEYTAHIFFKHRWYGFDDALYTAARFLELMDKHSCCADTLLDALPDFYCTPELSIHVTENNKFTLMTCLTQNMKFDNAEINTLDGIRVTFKQGWGLIRVSNTTPKLVLRFEAQSESALTRIISVFKQEILRVLPDLKIHF